MVHSMEYTITTPICKVHTYLIVPAVAFANQLVRT